MLKYKLLHPKAKEPLFATEGAACFDIYTVDGGELAPLSMRIFKLGIAVEIDPDFSLRLYIRSGRAFNEGLGLVNGVGVIDSDYRGEIAARVFNFNSDRTVEVGPLERLVQAELVRKEKYSLFKVPELLPTVRGEGGFGSTGTL